MERIVELGTLITPAKTVRCGNGTYPVLSMTMHNGLVFQDEKFKKVIASKDTSDYKVVYRNQLVISFPIDEGVLAAQRITDAGIVSPAYGIWNIDQSQILPEFLEYALRCNRALQYYKAKLRGSTARRRSLPTPTLLAFTIPLPSIVEQKEILVKIRRAKGLLEKREAQIRMLEELIKSRFVEMFGDPELNPMRWPVEAVGGVLSVEPQNGLYKPQSDYVQDGTGIPILRIDAFYDGKVTDFSGLKRLNCTDTERSRYLLMENDVVINRVNSLEYLGKCAWITGLMEPTVFESNMMRFHVDESRIDPCYMTRLLCSEFIYKQILNKAKKAVNQASINQRDVQSFKILVPPVGLQKQYAAFVAQVDKSKFAIQRSHDELELLFNSLMQQYFG